MSRDGHQILLAPIPSTDSDWRTQILQFYVGHRVTLYKHQCCDEEESSHSKGEHSWTRGWRNIPKIATRKRFLSMEFSCPLYSPKYPTKTDEGVWLLFLIQKMFQIYRDSKTRELKKPPSWLVLPFWFPDLAIRWQQCMLRNNINSEPPTNPAVRWNMKSIYVKCCFTEFET